MQYFTFDLLSAKILRFWLCSFKHDMCLKEYNILNGVNRNSFIHEFSGLETKEFLESK